MLGRPGGRDARTNLLSADRRPTPNARRHTTTFVDHPSSVRLTRRSGQNIPMGCHLVKISHVSQWKEHVLLLLTSQNMKICPFGFQPRSDASKPKLPTPKRRPACRIPYAMCHVSWYENMIEPRRHLCSPGSSPHLPESGGSPISRRNASLRNLSSSRLFLICSRLISLSFSAASACTTHTRHTSVSQNTYFERGMTTYSACPILSTPSAWSRTRQTPAAALPASRDSFSVGQGCTS